VAVLLIVVLGDVDLPRFLGIELRSVTPAVD
jgi:hypothetical protein